MSWRETTIAGYIFNLLVTSLLGSCALSFGALQALLQGLWPPRGDLLPVGLWIRWVWAFVLLRFYGIRVELEGPGCRSIPKSCVIVSNHQSALDILALVNAYPWPFAFLSKKELLMIPIFGWAAWMCGTVYIDRKRGVQDQAMSVINRVLRRGGSVAVFPEGTRSSTGNLLPFKRGAFVMAIDAQAPILPIVITGAASLLPKGSVRVRSGVIRVWIGEAISTQGLKHEDRFTLCDKVQQIISNRLDSGA